MCIYYNADTNREDNEWSNDIYFDSFGKDFWRFDVRTSASIHA